MNAKTRERIDQLLNAEVDRRDFLKYCGVAILTVIGISGLLRVLSGAASKPTVNGPKVSGGYGGRAFGE